MNNDFLDQSPCPRCHGARLSDTVLAVTVGGKNIHEFCSMSVSEALDFVNGLVLTETENMIAREILKEIKSRLNLMVL